MSYHAIQEVWEILIGHMFDNWLLCDSTNHFILNHFISFDRSHLSLRQLLLSSLILIHYSFLLKSFFAITSWLVSHFHITHFILLIFSVTVIFASVVHVSRFRAWTLFIPFLCQLYVISLRVRFAVSIHFALLNHALSFISCQYFFTQLVHVSRFQAWI